MKQTLIEIQSCYTRAAKEGREPSPFECAAIIRRRLPAADPDRERYLRGMGEFIGQALNGGVIDPVKWTPPD